MSRLTLLLLFLACGPGLTLADEIETVLSWDHYRDIMISDGKTTAEADERISAMLASLGSMDRAAGNDRIGVAAPSFEFDGWLNSGPLSLEDLRGQVVLVRWWTETCPFCASSAPALRAINEQYSPRGLTVIGVYHPKADRDSPLECCSRGAGRGGSRTGFSNRDRLGLAERDAGRLVADRARPAGHVGDLPAR